MFGEFFGDYFGDYFGELDDTPGGDGDPTRVVLDGRVDGPSALSGLVVSRVALDGRVIRRVS